MSVRKRVQRLPLLALALCAGIDPASALDDAFSDARPRRVHVVRRPLRADAYVAPPALISGYLPRNNAVPLYNEPPGLRDRGYVGR